jgi:hypothetical protein
VILKQLLCVVPGHKWEPSEGSQSDMIRCQRCGYEKPSGPGRGPRGDHDQVSDATYIQQGQATGPYGGGG